MDLAHNSISTLAPLDGHQIVALDVSYNRLKTLAPLEVTYFPIDDMFYLNAAGNYLDTESDTQDRVILEDMKSLNGGFPVVIADNAKVEGYNMVNLAYNYYDIGSRMPDGAPECFVVMGPQGEAAGVGTPPPDAQQTNGQPYDTETEGGAAPGPASIWTTVIVIAAVLVLAAAAALLALRIRKTGANRH
jgi:hypothetical protein